MLKHADSFGQVAAGFAFSMLGFLAAAMALFAIVGNSRTMKRYRTNGFLGILLLGISWTILELSLAFVSSLRLFVDPVTPDKIDCALLALAAGLGMTLICFVPILGIQLRAAHER